MRPPRSQQPVRDVEGHRIVRGEQRGRRGLHPDREYVYAAVHDGAQAEFGAFRTAPAGRAAFTFTSFGDQGAPNLRRAVAWPKDTSAPSPAGRFPLYTSSQAGTAASADIVAAVERVGPLFHLLRRRLWRNIAKSHHGFALLADQL